MGQPQGGGMMSGLGGALMSGMAMGTGSAIAHRAIDGIAGPRHMVVEHEQKEEGAAAPMSTLGASKGISCGEEDNIFKQCLQTNPNNYSACKFYYDMLAQCQANSAQKFQ